MDSTRIKLGDTDIEVPQLTIGQLEKVADWLTEGQEIEKTFRAQLGHNLKLLAIAFETSTPRYAADQISSLRATVGDVAGAVTAILRVAGLSEEIQPDPEVAAPEGASPPSLIESSASSLPAAGTLPN